MSNHDVLQFKFDYDYNNNKKEYRIVQPMKQKVYTRFLY